MRAIAIIDGEHYPPVVRAALAELRGTYEVVAGVFVGGTEKLPMGEDVDHYGVPTVHAADALVALADAIERYAPEVAIDLSDEPVLTAAARLALANVALEHGVAYQGADFSFTPPRDHCTASTLTLSIIGTGKRVGKTAISAFVGRYLKATGREPVIVAMGRGGPETPELIHGEEVELTTSDLLALARAGAHAASDNYEDAVMSRVTTVGCRRCGGGLAGETFFSNVCEGVALADTLGKQVLVAEGSGAAIPPVRSDATLLVVGAGRGLGYVDDYFGPYRLARADAVVIAGAELPVAAGEDVAELITAIHLRRPGVPVLPVVLRPRPLADVSGKRVFFATTAQAALLRVLIRHLESTFGCTVVGASCNLSDRARLQEDVAACAGTYDLLLTELKAAAIDVVAEAGSAAGVPTVLCDNEPIALHGASLEHTIEQLLDLARLRHAERSR